MVLMETERIWYAWWAGIVGREGAERACTDASGGTAMGLSTGSKGQNTRGKAVKSPGGRRPSAQGGRATAPENRSPRPGSRDLKLNGITSAAVEKATGKGWSDWIAALDRDGAAKMSHKEIAGHLNEKRGVGEWWCQMVTVGYEHAKGRRRTHERPDGFEVSVSKTLPVPVAAVVAAFADPKVRAKWLRGEKLEIRGITPGKAVRITWGDGTNVVVGFYGSTGAKAKVSVQHGKLRNAKEADLRKAFWKDAMERLKQVLIAED
jgi:hypothetical protein